MNTYLFQVLQGSTLRQAKAELSRLGLCHIYCIEEDATGEILIGGTSTAPFPSPLQHSILTQQTGEIDWTQQWAAFAQNFHDGKAHIDLSPFGASGSLLLLPGPGFGDLSHPTTHLMLQLMATRINSHPVIDIGCGSGILTLAALLLGAPSAIGIDIDPLALQHARHNANLNKLSATFSQTLPVPFPPNPLFLMNMILPEQATVMNRPPLRGNWITSGILATQRAEYLAMTKGWGWIFQTELQKGEWLGMVFTAL